MPERWQWQGPTWRSGQGAGARLQGGWGRGGWGSPRETLPCSQVHWAGRASEASLNPEPKGLWPRPPRVLPDTVTPVAPAGWGLQGRAWSPCSGEPWTRCAEEFGGIRWRDGTPGIEPGLRGAREGAGRWAGGWRGVRRAFSQGQIPRGRGLLAAKGRMWTQTNKVSFSSSLFSLLSLSPGHHHPTHMCPGNPSTSDLATSDFVTSDFTYSNPH